jgi:myosin heavy subunit
LLTIFLSYLLEKSRVVHQQDLERNYHFFYQIVAAAADNSDLAKLLFFTDSEEHFYLSQSSVSVIEGLSDLEQFNEVQSAMEVLGMSTEQQMQVLQIVAGILHLGNISELLSSPSLLLLRSSPPPWRRSLCIGFSSTDTSGDSAAVIDNTELLDHITALLGFDKSETRRCLTSRNIGSRSIITCPYTPSQAVDARDALAKKLYACLFDWLIATINTSLSGQTSPSQIFIAVLDIFGFEAFQHNSFEQLWYAPLPHLLLMPSLVRPQHQLLQ